MRYTSAENRDTDDFGVAFTKKEGEHVYDGATYRGPWATMSETSWKVHGCGVLGTGRGQKYRRSAEGHLVKVGG